jgi:hypothetical protein
MPQYQKLQSWVPIQNLTIQNLLTIPKEKPMWDNEDCITLQYAQIGIMQAIPLIESIYNTTNSRSEMEKAEVTLTCLKSDFWNFVKLYEKMSGKKVL